jgi:DSF synthase
MGAYSFLARRVGARLARQIVGSGRIYTGEELHEMGIVDVIADDGKGEAALLDYIHENRPKRGLRHYFDKIDRLVQPIEKNELLAIAELWVDRALEIRESDLKLMERLAAAQMRQFHNLTAGRAPAVTRTTTSG